MGKLVYVKPQMLVERFVSTQSVVAACEKIQVGRAAIIKENDPVCDAQHNGHRFRPKKMLMNHSVYQEEWLKDGQLGVFNEGISGCELLYDKHLGSDMNLLGQLITGNASFDEDGKHKMVIDGIQIQS